MSGEGTVSADFVEKQEGNYPEKHTGLSRSIKKICFMLMTVQERDDK
jgi:hypothetical protein